MKKIIFLICFCTAKVIAQPYFMDTLNTAPLYLSPCMGNVFELPNNQGYAVSNFYNYEFQIIYTNSYGHRTGQKTWGVFDTLVYSHGVRSMARLQNGNYIIAGQTVGPAHNYQDYFGNLIVLNSSLTDTILTKKYQYQYQNIYRNTFFYYVKTAPNGSIWIAGLTALTTQSNSITFLMHLSSTGTVLSQKHFNLTTGRNGPAYLSATSDGGCIVSILESGGNNDKQAIFIKLRADGSTQWTNEYGMIGQIPDDPLFIRKTQNPHEYWLFYNAGTVNAQNNYNGSTIFKAIKVDSVGNQIDEKIITTESNHPVRFTDMYQYPNGDILIGFWWRIVQNTTANLGNLYKLSSNLDSLWRKPLPRPNYYTNERTSVYEFLPMANGDIVVGGGYINGPLPSDAIFLCRLDSTGEIPVVATENVVIQKEKIKIFPNPTNDFVTFTNLSSKIESKGFLQIYDEQGKQVYSNSLIDFTSFTVNTSEWASGLYLYRYIVENVPSQEGKINIIK